MSAECCEAQAGLCTAFGEDVEGAEVGCQARKAEDQPPLVGPQALDLELTETERRQKHLEGEHVLALALPLIEEAAAGAATGSVSFRHDPMDAIEETLQGGNFHEVILSTLPRSVSRWLHVDLPSRVAHLGLPVTTVVAEKRAAAHAA